MCPAPQSPVTPPTAPIATTTTTTAPYIPPTTTTLPPVDRLGQFEGTSWDFVYTLVSTWTNSYTMGHSYTYTNSGSPILVGADEYGNVDGHFVGLTLVTDPSIPYEFLLLDPGITICEAFFFNITSSTQVAGQYFMFYSDCQTLVGSPDPFVGYLR